MLRHRIQSPSSDDYPNRRPVQSSPKAGTTMHDLRVWQDKASLKTSTTTRLPFLCKAVKKSSEVLWHAAFQLPGFVSLRTLRSLSGYPFLVFGGCSCVVLLAAESCLDWRDVISGGLRYSNPSLQLSWQASSSSGMRCFSRTTSKPQHFCFQVQLHCVSWPAVTPCT